MRSAGAPSPVMPGLVPGIHVLQHLREGSRGWPGRARPWRPQWAV